MTNKHHRIGVFDSGVGGLSVLSALKATLPQEHFVYLGDTARLPYGTKGPETVTRYAERAAQALFQRDLKCLVVACNTVSAVALPALQALNPDVPVIGVIESGAADAIAQTHKTEVAVIATEGTVARHAYRDAIIHQASTLQVHELACPLMVAMTEAGWTQGPLVEAIIEEHLKPLLPHFHDKVLDTLVLGCTHFPALKGAIAKVVGSHVTLIDSGESVAKRVKASLSARQALNDSGEGSVTFLVTDDKARFTRLANLFLGVAVAVTDVQLIDV